jgi:hypothetical protein
MYELFGILQLVVLSKILSLCYMQCNAMRASGVCWESLPGLGINSIVTMRFLYRR